MRFIIDGVLLNSTLDLGARFTRLHWGGGEYAKMVQRQAESHARDGEALVI